MAVDIDRWGMQAAAVAFLCAATIMGQLWAAR